MRDPKRLDDFYKKMCELHKAYFPDWRWGQMCSNFFGWLITEKSKDLFFPEENDMMKYFEEYCNLHKRIN